jgi:hypothetical protein
MPLILVPKLLLENVFMPQALPSSYENNIVLSISNYAQSGALHPMGSPSRSLGTREEPGNNPTCPLPCRLTGCPDQEDLTINAAIDGILAR